MQLHLWLSHLELTGTVYDVLFAERNEFPSCHGMHGFHSSRRGKCIATPTPTLHAHTNHDTNTHTNYHTNTHRRILFCRDVEPKTSQQCMNAGACTVHAKCMLCGGSAQHTPTHTPSLHAPVYAGLMSTAFEQTSSETSQPFTCRPQCLSMPCLNGVTTPHAACSIKQGVGMPGAMRGG